LGIDLDFVPMAADAEIGKNYKDMATWDDTVEMLRDKIVPWLRDGAPKDKIPESSYK
jgi:hypothetical protein